MITNKENVKELLGITGTDQDSLLDSLISQVDNYIKKYIGREIESGTYIEYFNGNYENSLVLKNYPIESITSLSFNEGTLGVPVWELIDENEYNYGESGILFYSYYLPRGKKNIKVEYVGGFDVIPENLVFVANSLVGKIFNQKNSNGVSAESVDGTSITWDKSISSNEKEILNMYKVYSI